MEYPYSTPDTLIERLATAQIVVTDKAHLHAQILAQLPQLRFIAITATGFNNIDIEYCRQAGIGVSNTRDYATNTIAEHSFGLLLALARSLLCYHQSVMYGRWPDSQKFCYFDYPIRGLNGATLVIVGKGSLGSAVARIANAFGMRVLFAEHKQATSTRDGYTPFTAALEQADAISLHCPLNQHTTNLLDAAAFASMRKQPLIVNTARGGLIQEEALLAALENGQISGAALDVLPQEPPPASSGLVAASRKFPNLLLTPHIAWADDQGQLAAWNQAMENLVAYARGEKLRRVV